MGFAAGAPAPGAMSTSTSRCPVDPDVERIHRIHDTIEAALFLGESQPGDVVVHFDPCDASLCRHCRMSDCAIREAAFPSRDSCSTASG